MRCTATVAYACAGNSSPVHTCRLPPSTQLPTEIGSMCAARLEDMSCRHPPHCLWAAENQDQLAHSRQVWLQARVALSQPQCLERPEAPLVGMAFCTPCMQQGVCLVPKCFCSNGSLCDEHSAATTKLNSIGCRADTQCVHSLSGGL